MEIVLNHRRPRNEHLQIAYITVSGVDAQVYKFQVGDVPASLITDQEVQNHLEKREDELEFFCLFKTYPGADYSEFKTDENTKLEALRDWIDAGAENPDGTVIANHTYAGTHPLRFPPAEDVLQEALDILAPFSDQTFEDLEDRAQADDDFIKEISLALLALLRFVDHNAH
ncbi:MAG: hypothetical protein V3W19_12205 [Desulfatiglandales bacterium]